MSPMPDSATPLAASSPDMSPTLSTEGPPTEAMKSIAFWRDTFPELSIGTLFEGQFALNGLSLASGERATQRMIIDGYFQEADPALPQLADRLAAGIARCVSMGIPPVFAFVFDEAWAVFHRQHQTIAAFLGASYQVLPDFWAWHVDPQAGQAGWRPHRDKGFQALAPDGSPLSLTVWVPLTEASPLNGCMYMLPASRDPVYGTTEDRTWQIDYPSIRALPGKPGDWFCWNQAVLHWGGQSSPFAEGPRMSMALEFQRSDIAPYNTPLLGTLPVLSFEDRMKLIAKQILQYAHMYPLPPSMQTLAQDLLS